MYMFVVVKTKPFSLLPIHSFMASSTTPQASFSHLLIRGQKGHHRHRHDLSWPITREISKGEKKGGVVLLVLGEQGSSSSSGGSGQKKASVVQPGVDTRIHWENEDEGWIGGGSSSSSNEKLKADDDDHQKHYDHHLNPDQNFSHLLNTSSFQSHYQFLGVSEEADLEEIKGAYRRLSKEYHPDTTSLPVKAASEKFMKLKQVYNVLSDEERRRFYDWTVAQEAASREAEKMKLRMKLEDPYIQDIHNWESVPDMVDRLGGRNMDLSDQALSALTFDLLIIVFAICCIIYAIFFKLPYY